MTVLLLQLLIIVLLMVGVKVWTVRSMTLLLAKQPQFMIKKKITVARGV